MDKYWTTIKSCSEFLKSTFFSLLPWLPKRPKQKNSCSKMWPIDTLNIELGFFPFLLSSSVFWLTTNLGKWPVQVCTWILLLKKPWLDTVQDFFVQIGHETTYASIQKKHFSLHISCYRQMYQNYEQPPQRLQNFVF